MICIFENFELFEKKRIFLKKPKMNGMMKFH